MLRRRKNLPFTSNADGTYTVGLDPDSREFLADLPRQLVIVIEARDEESTRRLFPPAYHRDEDSEREDEYRRFMRDDLVESKRASLSLLAQTAHLEHLTHAQLLGWMGAVNDIRLVLGTQIDVYEGLDVDDLAENDPRRPALSVYGWLSGVLELIVMGLTAGEGRDLFTDDEDDDDEDVEFEFEDSDFDELGAFDDPENPAAIDPGNEPENSPSDGPNQGPTPGPKQD